MSILSLNNVSYTYKSRYQTVEAVKGINWTFARGQVYAIVGKSGSGKTTLLSLLAGLDLPTSGQVVYRDKPTSTMNRDKYRREEVAVIYQAYNLFPLLTALENVMYPLELKGIKAKEAKAQAVDKIKSVGLTEKVLKRFPAMLSGGEQQRIAIARALAAQPKVILADEPTGNLDAENGTNIVYILKSLAHEQNCCVIIVTHDPAIAEQSDVLLQMQDGEISSTETVIAK